MSMRRSNKPEWLMDAETCIGIGLGSTSCSEHEHGTTGLNFAFGLNEALDGLPRRTMTLLPKGMSLIEFKTRKDTRMKRPSVPGLALIYDEPYFSSEPAHHLKDELAYFGESKLAAAWNDRSFGITAYTEEDRIRLKVLWDAFHRNDVAFWTNVGVFHSGTGLTFAVPSLVPEVHKTTMLEGDLDIKRLLEASKATGVEALLKQAGKRWMGLAPKWSKELKSTKDGIVRTEFEVLYWLDPWGSDNAKFGYFTVEDLRLWAKNEGPVLKNG